MIGLAILLATLVGSLLLSGVAVTLGARLVGSARARLRVGMLAILLIAGINVILAAAVSAMSPKDVSSAIAVAVLMLCIQCVVAFAILRRMFRLSAARGLGPLAGLIVSTAIQLCFAVLILRPYLIEAFIMPTQSMAPTLEPRDRFLVDKVAQPRRWDLVGYWQTEMSHRAIYCKRLVGLPGERLKFQGGNVYVNDKLVLAPPVVAGKYHASLARVPTKYHDGQTIVLANDQYFLIGDNVEVSADSRIYGPTIRADIVGPVDLIYWPLSKIRILR